MIIIANFANDTTGDYSDRVFIGCARPFYFVIQRTCWCPTMYGGRWGKSTFVIAVVQHRRLIVQVLHIITQITVSSIP